MHWRNSHTEVTEVTELTELRHRGDAISQSSRCATNLNLDEGPGKPEHTFAQTGRRPFSPACTFRLVVLVAAPRYSCGDAYLEVPWSPPAADRTFVIADIVYPTTTAALGAVKRQDLLRPFPLAVASSKVSELRGPGPVCRRGNAKRSESSSG